MTDTHDVIIIGAGHNGLVCAATLAKAGRRVVVLERADRPGGAARTRTFAPGYSVSSGAHFLNQFPVSLIEELQLAKHGLRFAAKGLATVALQADGRHLRLDGAKAAATDLGAVDQQAFAEFHAEIASYAAVLAGAFGRRPPRLVDSDWRDRLGLLKLGWDIRTLGRDRMREVLRIGLMNIHDLASERFEDARLRSAVAFDAVLGTSMGPRAPNTVMSYLYRRTADAFGHAGPSIPVGGMGAFADALAAAATARGAEIRLQAGVASIVVHEGRATGVVLDSGEVLNASTVISNADPRTTLKGLVGYRELDAGFVRRVEGIRMRGMAAKLHLALDALPSIPGLDAANAGDRLVLCPSLEGLDEAMNPSKYRQFSAEPVIELCIPTLHDPSLAPPGKHVISAVVQYAPVDLEGGWTAAARAEFEARIMARLETVMPGIGSLVSSSELCVAPDIQSEFGIHGGHWHHGEISVDQLLMMRPVVLFSQYAMPIDGLWLCGAGAHPGGGVMGLAGRNCAQEIIRKRASA
jgi:phytoene dehydrogenase-like protein